MGPRLVFPDDVRPDFTGFGDAALAFLRELAENNARAWFAARRDVYEAELRFPLECLVAAFRADGAGAALPVRGDPSKGLFRIHRDIRFSRDKRPYKTHAGAVLSRSGARDDPGAVYVHIEPGASFLSAGFWRPDRALLTAWRRRMAEAPEDWLAVAAPYGTTPGAAPFMRPISTLKTMPRGFSAHAASPIADHLKWSSFLLTRELSDAEVKTPDLVEAVRAHALRAAPLLAYGWALVDRAAEDDPRRHMRGRQGAAAGDRGGGAAGRTTDRRGGRGSG